MASLVSFRIDDQLKNEFTRAAESRHLSQSDAIREALVQFVRRIRNEQMRDAAERIRQNRQEEADVMSWIASVSDPDED